jgi:CrcB protein
MRMLAAVALGGALGSVARWTLGGWVQGRASASRGVVALFPSGTLAVNLLGCLLIGVLATLFEERFAGDPALRTFVLVGLLGGFTTFSSFGFETFALMRAGNLLLAGANIAGNLVVGLAAVWLGAAVTRLL